MTAQSAMIDVSAYNHISGDPIQWGRVRVAKYMDVMIKATEGVDYVNPWLERDATEATAAGLRVGFYHFAHPGRNAPAAEARFALTAIRGLPRVHGLALDLEVVEGLTWSELAMWAQAFHEDVLREVDHSPLYVNDNFLANLPGAPWGERLWLPQTARPRRRVWAWQMTTPALVPGIEAPTDVGFLHPDA